MTKLTIYDDNYQALVEAAKLLGDPIDAVIDYLVTDYLPVLIEDLRNVHYNNL